MTRGTLLVAAGALLLAGAAWSEGKPPGNAAHPGVHPGYRVVHGWPRLPEGKVLVSVAGVGVDSRGDVFVFRRAGRTWPLSDVLELNPIPRPTIDVFDGRSGALLRRWGENRFAMPHGLTIDGHDNTGNSRWRTRSRSMLTVRFMSATSPALACRSSCQRVRPALQRAPPGSR